MATGPVDTSDLLGGLAAFQTKFQDLLQQKQNKAGTDLTAANATSNAVQQWANELVDNTILALIKAIEDGEFSAKRKVYWEAHNSWTSLNDAFFDFVDTTESTNIDDLGSQRIAPFAGSVTKIWLRRELGAAVEDVGVEVRSVTDTDPLTSALEEFQEVVNPPSDNELFVLPDYVANSFAEGAMLAFKLIKTGGTFQNDVRVLIEYTET